VWELGADLRPVRRRCDPHAASRQPVAGSLVSLQPRALTPGRNSTRHSPAKRPNFQSGQAKDILEL